MAPRTAPKHLIIVRKRRFKLTLYERIESDYVRIHTCRIAIGSAGFTTPAGPMFVQKKEKPPTYTAPDSQWAKDAGYTPGQKLTPDDPANPIRGAFIWLTSTGIGIHGTSNLLSLGTKASHGCVRVSEEDAVRIHDLVEIGTPVVVL